MQWWAHLALSLVVWAVISSLVPSFQHPLTLLSLLLGGVFPDIDTRRSYMFKLFALFLITSSVFALLINNVYLLMATTLTLLLTLTLKHRGKTHTYASAVLFSLPLTIINTTWALAFFIGYSTHLMADNVTRLL